MSNLSSRKHEPGGSQLLVTRTKQCKMINNKQDPVQRLPLEIIAKIISYLEAEDTETLRRLSKSWKNASETSHTRQAILRHFPRSSCPPLATGMEYNLHFRRLLYHKSSLKRGRATRSHYFPNISKWSIRRNTLLLRSHQNELYIYDLRSCSGDRLEAEDCVIKIMQEFLERDIMDDSSVLLTVHGVIVVRYCLSLVLNPADTCRTRTIMTTISTDLTQQWSMTFDSWAVTVGTDLVYGLVFTESQKDTKVHLVTHSLESKETSEVLVAGFFPRELKKCAKHFTFEIVLTSNGQVLILKNDKQIFGSIDVLASQIVFTTGAKSPANVTSLAIFLRPESADFRISVLDTIVNQFEIYDYEYDADLAAYNVSLVSAVDCGEGEYAARVVLAADLPNRLVMMQSGQTYKGIPDGTWEFVIKESSTWKRYSNITIPSPEGRANLLLPGSDDSKNWDTRARIAAYFGMVDGYLVYHDATDGRLMVADFWPSW